MKKLLIILRIFICSLLSVFTFSTSSVADFYDDQDFDGSDLAIFSSAYESEIGFDNYNIDADFANDGDVDKVDLVEFARNFGYHNLIAPEISVEIGSEGGNIEVTDTQSTIHGTKVDIPAGALTETKLISIAPSSPSIKLPGFSSTVFPNFSPSGHFEKEVVISLPYPDEDDDGLIDGTNFPEINVEVVTYGATEIGNILEPFGIDTEQNILKVRANHFSLWSWLVGEELPYNSVSGFVRCKETGAGVENVEVYLNEITDNSNSRSVQTNSDGFYIFENATQNRRQYIVELGSPYAHTLPPKTLTTISNNERFIVGFDVECPCHTVDYYDYTTANYWWGDRDFVVRTPTDNGLTMLSPNDKGSHPATLWQNPQSGGSYIVTANLDVSKIDYGGGQLIFTDSTYQGNYGSDPINPYTRVGVYLRNGFGYVDGIGRIYDVFGRNNKIKITVSGGIANIEVNGTNVGTTSLVGDNYIGILGQEAYVTITNLQICQ